MVVIPFTSLLTDSLIRPDYGILGRNLDYEALYLHLKMFGLTLIETTTTLIVVYMLTLFQLTVCCIEVCMRLCSRQQATPTKPKKEKGREHTLKVYNT